jgi:hypothetical protein
VVVCTEKIKNYKEVSEKWKWLKIELK